ncbi:probable G-protein coupled receptor 160 [Trichomycterus rosablanca]|uniref:probable G-protein coupled receptor 160 n=1 Tax=Trichomycterus rosablanca TaxID=2290929 RepID=UPI002F358C1F
MEVSMTNLLAALWLKSLLNWVVLAVQKGHVTWSLVGVFCVGVLLADTFLHLTLTLLFLVQDVYLAELHLTRYHVCLLTQAACSVYDILQWPVFILAGLDSYWSGRWSRRVQKRVYVVTVLLMLMLAVIYVFQAPDPDPEDGDYVTEQKCHVTGGSQSLQVFWLVMLIVVGMICFRLLPTVEMKRAALLKESVSTFLSTWRTFLLLLLFILVSRTPVPPYLVMNAVWLGFVHSLHTAVTLTNCNCIFHKRTELQHLAVPHDSSSSVKGSCLITDLIQTGSV